jgi:hypothetical protein
MRRSWAPDQLSRCHQVVERVWRRSASYSALIISTKRSMRVVRRRRRAAQDGPPCWRYLRPDTTASLPPRTPCPGRGTSPRQSPCGRNVTPDLGAERIDGAEVEHWRHEALLELPAMIDTAGAHRGTRRGALLHRTARRRTRRTHRVILIDAGPRTRTRRAATSTPT